MEKEFVYRTYGKGELAQLYSPHASIGAARRKLMFWISMQPDLLDQLHAIGFIDSNRTFTPAQVRLIVEALGEPGWI